MSAGSIHSSRGLTCSRLMRVASSRFWMSLLSRSASSRTTLASELSRSSLAIAGDWFSTVAAPRMEASGVRSSWETEPISASRSSSVSERILASLSACATSSRSSVAAASDSTSSTRWRMSATSSAGTLPRSMAITPKSGVCCETRRTSQILPVSSVTLASTDGRAGPPRWRRAPGSAPRLRRPAWRRRPASVPNSTTLRCTSGEMLLDRAIDLGRRRRRRQAARERVKVAHLVLVLAGELGLPLHGIGEMAGHQRDDHEQNEIEHLGALR